MPSRARHAARTKKTPSDPHSYPAGSLAQAGAGNSTSSSSANQTPLDSLAPSPAAQLPTPLPEPAERVKRKKKTTRSAVEDATAVAWGLDAEPEVREETMPHLDFTVGGGRVAEGEEDADADVLGRLIDFDDSVPSSPQQHHGALLVEGDEGASLSGFLNDHLDAPVDGHDFNTMVFDQYDRPASLSFGLEDTRNEALGMEDARDAEPFAVEVGRGVDNAGFDAESFGVPEATFGGGALARAEEYAYPEEEPQPSSYRSPPFMQVSLPEVEVEVEEAGEEALPVPPPMATETKKEKGKKKKTEREAREREAREANEGLEEAEERVGLGDGGGYGGRDGHVRAPVVARSTTSTPGPQTDEPHLELGGYGHGHARAPPTVASRTVSSASSHSHSRSPSLNPPPSLTHSSSSTSASTFSSLSKTIRSYAPSLPLALPSPKSLGKKGAPYPPLVSRPVIAGRVDSGIINGYGQEYGGEDARDDDEGYAQEPYNYGYSKSPPATPQSFLPEVRPRATPPTHTSTRAASVNTSRTTSRATSTVPERQGAWPEYAQASTSPQSPTNTRNASRHRSTKSQGSQAGLGSGLTQTLRGDGQFQGASGSSSLLVVPTRGRENQGVYPRAEGGEGDVDKVVWARWDTLSGDGRKKTDVLVVGYERGVQVWDVGNLERVAEVLNLNFGGDGEGEWVEEGESVAGVVKGVVVPGREGVLALLLETQDRTETKSSLVLYSMKDDRVVGRWATSGVPVDVECSRDVFIVSTSSPPALHILSPALKLLHTLPASSLALFSTPRATSSTSQLQLTLPSPVSASSHPRHPHGDTIDSTPTTSAAHRVELPHAVFALHGRLLAYAIPFPPSSSASLRHKDSSLSSSSSGPSPSSLTSGSPLGAAGMGQGLGLGSGIGGIPNTKAELGSAALKVGSGLIGGMRFLGGMALEGVKNRMGAPSPTASSQHSRGSSLSSHYGVTVQEYRGGGGGRGGAERGGMFSRSAPTNESVTGLSAEEEKKRRRFSDIQHHGVLAPLSAIKRSSSAQGYAIVVVDLASLTTTATPYALDETIKDAEGGDGERKLRVVAEFVGSRSQPIAGLGFTPDGCGVYVVPRDGFVTKVFHLRPSPSSSIAASTTTSSLKEAHSTTGTALPLYELRRGRVSTAVVESIKAVPDSRWTGVVTRNRTVHVFATNPHGGKSHIPSHLEGRMRNSPNSIADPRKIVELKPLVRLTGEKLTQGDYGFTQEYPPPAMAFTFVDPAATILPLVLAPSPLPRSAVGSASSPPPTAGLSLSASPGSPLAPKYTAKAPRNHQDVLLFDSASGVLSLQRISVEQRTKSELGALGMGGGTVGGLVNAAINVSTSLGSKSISASLPGMGGAGPLGMTSGSVVSSSVSSQSGVAGGGGPGGIGGRGMGGQRQGGIEEGYELTGKVNVVATWDLRKRRGCEEIRGKVGVDGGQVDGGVGVGCDEWLAQAELSTFSKSRSSRGRSVYLTHQFSFHTLGEDYHALIRKYRLNVHGTKIDVRKEIPIHAFTSTSGVPTSESFVEGFSPTRTHSGGGVPSSFDEPLASALAGEMEYQPSSNVLPMYPNGPAGGTGGGRSLRNSIPIRKIGDGVSEGLGRIRRAAVRSPRLGPSRVGGGDGGVEDVLLEFDEEVDDFMAPRVINTAGQGMDDDVVGTVDEEIWGDGGWDSQDRMAVEEEEQFHAISKTLSPRFEEEVMLPPPASTPSVASKASSSASKKSRKSRK